MPDYRAKDSEVNMSDAMIFQQHYEVRTTHPLKDCINSQFLLNARSRFKAGDRVSIVRYINDTWMEVTEIAETVRVLHVDNDGVDLKLIGEIVIIEQPTGEGYVVDRGIDGRFAIRLDGRMVEAKNTWVEANERAQALATETGKPVKLYEKTKKAA